jgi:hypothetical protein
MKRAKHIVTEKSDSWNTVDDGLHLQRIFKRCGPSEGKEQKHTTEYPPARTKGVA